jgi:hypothetical protein
MKLFNKLFTALNKGSVKYLVAGGIAVNLYGIERATADIDLVLMLNGKNILKFANVAKKLGFKAKVPVKIEDFADPVKRREWREKKGMMVFSLYDVKNPFFLIDIFVDVPFDFEAVYKKREKVKFENTSIPLVPLEELIKMKKKSDRPQDKADIYYLNKVKRSRKNE